MTYEERSSTFAAAEAASETTPSGEGRAHAGNGVKVGVRMRFVPAGVQNGMLRGALVLHPVGNCPKGLPTVSLADWPAAARSLITAEACLEISGVTKPEDNGQRPLPADEGAPRSKITLREVKSNSMAEMTRFWRELMAPKAKPDDGNHQGWHDLAAALTPPPPKSPLAGRTKRARADAQRAPKTGSGDQENKNIPDILSTARGETGLLLSLERGRSVLDRLRDPGDVIDPTKGHSSLSRPWERLRTRQTNDQTNEQTSWLDFRTSATGPAIPDDEQARRERESAHLNKLLVDERRKTDGLARARRDYVRAKSASDLRRQLRSQAMNRTVCSPPAACALTIANGETEVIRGAIDRARHLHEAASRLDPSAYSRAQAQAKSCTALLPGLEGTEAAKNRFFAIQSQPSLARLFGLVFDVEITEPKLPSHWTEFHGDDAGDTFRFAFVAPVFKTSGYKQSKIWTCAKFRDGDGHGPRFWACTREELDAHACGLTSSEIMGQSLASQIDGVLDLGASVVENGACNPRFDILTLDVQRVAEGDRNLELSQRQMGSTVMPVGPLSSGGLLLVDRWRQHRALSQAIAGFDRKADEMVILDAEDLTIGYKLDVGLDPEDGHAPQWRGLMNRTITFSHKDPKFKDLLETVLPSKPEPGELGGFEPWELNAALLTFPSRIRENAAGEGEAAPGVALPTKTAYVEEILAQWKGPPLGVDLESTQPIPRAPDVADDCEPIPAGRLTGTGLLQLGQNHSLPPPDATGRPPRLRFSWPYRLGVRPTLAGGISLSLREAARAYNATHGGRLALPAVRAGTKGRRALRHEAIQAPVVTTPEAILKRKVFGPQETSLELVVRAQTIMPKGAHDGVTRASLGKETTHRVVIPPVVALEFADRHGVFDDLSGKLEVGPGGRKRPLSGLDNVDYDQPQVGGFPVWSTQSSSEAVEYPGKLASPSALLPKPTGDAIFRWKEADTRGQRRLPYYPDPAADYMVFRIRRRDGGDVHGESLVVPIRPGPEVRYPNVRPIIVELVGARERSGKPPAQERILGLYLDREGRSLARGHAAAKKKPAIFAASGEETIGVSGQVPATRIQVRLEPGESYELDMWCLPTKEHLRDWFDVVEAAAVVAGAHGPNGTSCTTAEIFIENLAGVLGMPVEQIARGAHLSRDPKSGAAGCTAGQLPLPDETAMSCLAGHLWNEACQTLFPEICARTTIGVTHALDRPYEAPRRLPPPDAAGEARTGLTVIRVDLKTRRDILAQKEPEDTKAPQEQKAASASRAGLRDPAAWDREATIPGGTDVVIGGVVGLHRETSSFLEVAATGPSLLTSAFDDPARGRSEDDRARGIWPDDRKPGAPKNEWRRPPRMFGFEVDEHGCVTLPEEKAILMRLDEIASRDAISENAACDLLAEQRRHRALPRQVTSDDPKAGAGLPSRQSAPAIPFGTTYPDKISDTKARVLRFELIAGSRTSNLIWDERGRSLPPGEQTRSSSETDPPAPEGRVKFKLRPDPLPVALPASAAPARLSPLTLLPLFETRRTEPVCHGVTTTFEVRRITRLRLRARRPWFSSGAGERLGIVLWPPEIFDTDPLQGGSRDDNHAFRNYDTEPRFELMDMTGYDDTDLGPGGHFVSRWGGDPTKTRAPESWLISTRVFEDLPQPIPSRGERLPWTPVDPDADDVEVIYVPRATMPVPIDENDAPAASAAGKTIEVALLAYKPRFDIDQEHWYFDLTINPHVAIEPFVRLGLVRYQGNAPKALRVSEPVVEWAQLLPERCVRVTVTGRGVKVVVKGHAADLPFKRDGNDLSTSLHDRHGPRMRIEIFRRDANGVESLAELAPAGGAARSGKPGTASRETGPTGSGAMGSQWSCVFDLREDPLEAKDASYSVVVTETDLMHPASYRAEPFDPAGTDDELVETGPRFAARIELACPAPASEGRTPARTMREHRD